MKAGMKQQKTPPDHWQPVSQRNGFPLCQQVFPNQACTQTSPNVNGMLEN